MSQPTRYRGLALALVVGGCFAQFSLYAVDYARMYVAWAGSMGLWSAFLCVLVACAYPSREVFAAAGLSVVCGLLTAGCSVAFLIRPWANTSSGSRCSAALDLPVGVLSALAFLWLAWRLYEGSRNGG